MMFCFLLLQVISVEPPNFVELEVVDTPPGVKGNTASGEPSSAAAQHTLWGTRQSITCRPCAPQRHLGCKHAAECCLAAAGMLTDCATHALLVACLSDNHLELDDASAA
jgi:hypothetical protein